MKLKYKLGLVIIGVMIIMCFMTFQSYALFVANLSGNENSLDVGCFKIEFTESSSSIALSNTYPMNDTKGLTITPYTFTITNKCTNDASYSVVLSSLTTNGIDDGNIKYAIYETTKPSTGTLLTSATTYTDTYNLANVKNRKNSYQVATGGLKGATEENGTGGSKTYNLILWLDEATGNDAMSKTFEASINIVSAGVEIKPVTTKITELASNDTVNMATDDYGNIRYIGADPNNYINVDGDIWRIIGVMKDIDDGTGNKEDRVKIVRASSIGEYSWDSSSSDINKNFGINEWSQADLMKLLNPGYESERIGGSLYWDNKSGKCYNDSDNTMTLCDFTVTGLNDKLKTLIDDAVWNIGSQGTNSWTSENGGLTKHFYMYERSSNNGKVCTNGDECTDTVERTTEWTGKIGLIYPSDYGYATSGGDSLNRDSCLNNAILFEWNNYSKCYSNDWLYTNDYKWLLSPQSISDSSAFVYSITSERVNGNNSYVAFNVYPSAYLKSTVKIALGTGSSSDPFILEE